MGFMESMNQYKSLLSFSLFPFIIIFKKYLKQNLFMPNYAKVLFHPRQAQGGMGCYSTRSSNTQLLCCSVFIFLGRGP